MDVLADWLRSPRCPREVRDAVWARLVTRSRAEHGAWTVVCAGVALPMLVSVAGRLTDRFAGPRADIDAAVLAGFLAGLDDVDLTRPGVLVSLRWRAYRAGAAALRAELDAPTPDHDLTRSPPAVDSPLADLGGPRSVPSSDRCGRVDAVAAGTAPVGRRPDGHPDLVLARAVAAGAVTAAEAALIGETRLDRQSVADAAADRGVSVAALYQRRRRAEARLRTHLTTLEDSR